MRSVDNNNNSGGINLKYISDPWYGVIWFFKQWRKKPLIFSWLKNDYFCNSSLFPALNTIVNTYSVNSSPLEKMAAI